MERMARYYVGVGVVFADDFIQKNIGPERMKLLDLTGAYVIRMDSPTACIFITFGAGGCFIPDSPVAQCRSPTLPHPPVPFKLYADSYPAQRRR